MSQFLTLIEVVNFKEVIDKPRLLFRNIKEFLIALMSEYALSQLEQDDAHPIYKIIEKYYWYGESVLDEIFLELLQNESVREVLSGVSQEIIEALASPNKMLKWNTENEMETLEIKETWSNFLNQILWKCTEDTNFFNLGKDCVRVKKSLLQLTGDRALVFLKQNEKLIFKSIGNIGQNESYDLHHCFGSIQNSPSTNELVLKTISEEEFFKHGKTKDSDERQKQAIVYDLNKHLVVLAGAGSGKTRTLVNRLAYMRMVKGVPLQSITLLTFSNEAKLEMKARGEEILNRLYTQAGIHETLTINTKTIDAFFYNLVKMNWANFGFKYQPDFKLGNLGAKLKEEFLTEIICENYQEMYSDCLNQPKQMEYLIRDLDLQAKEIFVARPGMQNLFEQFMNIQISKGVLLDYQYIAQLVKRTLLNNKQFRESVAEQHPFILIDEFQDVDRLQYSIFNSLLETGKTVFTFVGDDDQSIYGWRGSDNQIIRDISKRFDRVYLLTNYRNNPNIVKAGNCILHTITERAKSEEIRANNVSGPKIKVVEFDSKFENLVNEINKLLKKVNSSEIAILVRDNKVKKAIIEALQAAEIPVNISKSINPLSSRAYLTLRELLWIWSDSNVYSHCHQLKELLKSPSGRRESEILKAVKGKNGWQGIDLNILRHLSQAFTTEVQNLSELVNLFSLQSQECFNETGDDVINEFETLCKNFKVNWPVSENKLSNLLSVFEHERVYQKRKAKKSDSGVTIVTIHDSKGLEYDVVFIVGLSQGKYPNTEHIDYRYLIRLKELESLRGSKQRFLTMRSGMSQSIMDEIVNECNNPEIKNREIELFLEEILMNRSEIIAFYAQGIKAYNSAFQEFIQPILRGLMENQTELRQKQEQYNQDLKSLNDEITLLNQSESNDTKKDQVSIENELKIIKNELACIRQKIKENMLKRKNLNEGLQTTIHFYQQSGEALNVLDAIQGEEKIEEVKKSLLKDKEKQINEERRTFYVAITRARYELYLCREKGTTSSEFIKLIDQSLTETPLLLTAHEEEELARLREGMRRQTELVEPDELFLNEASQKLLSINQDITKNLEQKVKEYVQNRPDLQKVSGVEKTYLNRALSLMFLKDITGYEFDMEVVHNLQRLAEERLLLSAGSEARLYQTNDHEELEMIVREIGTLMSKGDTSAPLPKDIRNVFKKFSSEPVFLKRFKILKKLGMLHFFVRCGRFEIPISIRNTWSCKSLTKEKAEELLLATKELANLRNRMTHETLDAWPEEPISKAMKYLKVILDYNPYKKLGGE